MFNLRSCNLEIPSPTGRKYKVCLDYHIGRCGGPCENLESAEQYKQHVDAVLMFLSGRRTDLIKVLTERMQEHSARMEFEQAARVRDTIDALESVRQKQKVDAAAEVDRDIVAFARGAGREVVAVVMQIREGILIGKQDFQMQANPDMGSDDVLTGFLQQYYNSSENFPAEILLPFEIADVALLERWLTREKGSRVRIVATRKGDRRSLVDMAQKNARLLLDELLLQKQKHKEKVPALIASLQKDLALAKPPRTIGCFDISNLGESDKVASMVYFLDGKPRKSEYRRFKIKSVQGQDDFASMREVIDRYFTRAMKEKRTLPDLIVVDGGKGQLSAAKEIIDSLGLASHPIIGLAKRLEEVFLPGYAEPVSIPKDSASLNMLKRIRDEAHRFAITYHRQMRGKRLVSSELDNITGVGKSRRQLLMDHFGSLRRIRQAPLEELSAIDGIPDRVARSVFDYFQSSQKESAQSDQ